MEVKLEMSLWSSLIPYVDKLSKQLNIWIKEHKTELNFTSLDINKKSSEHRRYS